MSDVSLGRRIKNKAHDIMHNLSARVFGSSYYEKEWANQQINGFYWESVNHPHRKMLVSAILRYSPDSVLEIGCNTAPNLYLLAKKIPNGRLNGIDVGMSAIEEGKKLLARESVRNVTLDIGRADDLSRFADKSFDVVFCDAVMIYIGKDKIERVTNEMMRVTKRAIVLCEWHDPHAGPRGRFLYKKGYWVRDYASLFNGRNRTTAILIEKITRDIWDDDYWSKYGHIIEVPLKDA